MMETETKQCPYCGREIKAVAKKCRYCGEWLEDNKMPQSEQSQSTFSANDSHNAVESKTVASEDVRGDLHPNKVGGIIIILLVVIGIICFWIINGNSSQSSYDDSTYENQTAEEPENEYGATIEDVSVSADKESSAYPLEGEPDEEDYNNSYASMRYSNKYAEVISAGMHLIYHDGKKLWYNYRREGSGYDNKLHIYDSETDSETTVRLNKTSMPDSEMEVTDMIVRDGGVLTIIMTENRNSNGWIEGTYVWQYFCSDGNWQALAKGCSGAEFVNNRTAVKVSYAESKNPDDPTYMQEYRYSYRTFNL